MKVLVCVVWLSDTGVQEEFLIRELVRHLAGHQDNLRFNRALKQLAQLGLLARHAGALEVSPLTSRILRDLHIKERREVFLAYERMIRVLPDSQVHTVLNPIHQEFLATQEGVTRFITEQIRNRQSPPLVLICINSTLWCMLASLSDGRRHVTLYQVTKYLILVLESDKEEWQVWTNPDVFIRAITIYYDLLFEDSKARNPQWHLKLEPIDPPAHKESRNEILDTPE